MTETVYQVKTASFEGPLEVLLGLIEKRKLFVSDISLASITDDFIGYVRNLDKKDMESYASFIAVAATLILIKSRSLIPNLELTAEEQEDISALERRVELYKLIKEIGIEIGAQFGRQIIFPKLERDIELKVFVPDVQISVASMADNIRAVLQAMPVEEEVKPEIVISKVRSLEEMIAGLVERVKTGMKMSFRDFSSSHGYAEGREHKVGVIVSFLAMLELVRQGLIHASQDADFADIDLEKRDDTAVVTEPTWN